MTPDETTQRDGRRLKVSLAAGRGFTLVEILIAMLILAVGILATLSMQFSALGGATQARDNVNTSEIARRIIQILQVESQQWTSGEIATQVNQSAFTDDTNHVAMFDTMPLLPRIVPASGNTWGSWQRIFVEPVDVRLGSSGNRRYCAWARGGMVPSPPENPGGNTGMARIQIAVMYPGANQQYPNVADATPAGTCPQMSNFSQLGAGLTLDPGLAPDDSGNPEYHGYRVTYFGTQVIRRGYAGP